MNLAAVGALSPLNQRQKGANGFALNLKESVMPVPARFRDFADQCARMAQHAQSSDDQVVLQRMAQAWRDLAAEEERFEQLVREADDAFGGGDEDGGLAKRLARAAEFATRRTH